MFSIRQSRQLDGCVSTGQWPKTNQKSSNQELNELHQSLRWSYAKAGAKAVKVLTEATGELALFRGRYFVARIVIGEMQLATAKS